MKIVGITSTALLSLLLGIAVPAYAQHEEQNEKQDHSEQQQGKHEQGKPEKQQHAQSPQHAQQQHRPEEGKQAHQAQQPDRNTEQQHAQQQQRTEPSKQQQQAHQQQNQNQQQQHAQQQQVKEQRNNQHSQRGQEQQRIQQSAWQQHRSQHWESDHRDWRQRGGYRGYRIPEDRFRGNFGPSHGFRIYGLPFMVVGGYPRFQYEGYWFSPVDPWPQYWGNDWYDNDDVYVNYVDDGYYLYNSRYPNVGIAINISM